MIAPYNVPAFHQEMRGWALRGILCALSSFYWAYVAGFRQPMEILGMVTGVMGWVLIFAWLTSRILPARKIGLRTVEALKRAAWIKFGVTGAGWLIFGLIGTLGLRGTEHLAILGMVDMWLGFVALGLGNLLGGFHGENHIASLDSYGWTAFTTFIDGALFAVVIGLLTCLILGWWRLRDNSGMKKELSPVRMTD